VVNLERKVFGDDFEYIILPVEHIAVLPQVRKIKNAKLDELIDSIESGYLINLIDVAKLTEAEFQSHIDFINALWKKDIKKGDFTLVDGFYYVAIAGHTRIDVFKISGKKNNFYPLAKVKIHPITTSEEILRVQLDENIHSEPRIEERAIAIIESYRIGIQNGRYQDKNDFIKKTEHKFSKRILHEALVFSDSPVEVQEYVFTSNIPYAVGVELGKMASLIERAELALSDSQEQLENNIRIHYQILLNNILKQKSPSGKRSLEILRGHADHLIKILEPKAEDEQEMIDWFLDSPNRQYLEYRTDLIAEYNSTARELNSMPFRRALELLNLDTSLTGLDHAEEKLSISSLYNRHLNNQFADGMLKRRR